MKKDIKIAHLVYRDKRLYLEYSFKGRKLSETDVTPLWHFFKEFQEYLKEPSDEITK